MKRPTELIEKAKGFKSTDPIRVLAEYAVSLESPRKTVSDAVDSWPEGFPYKHEKNLYFVPDESCGAWSYTGSIDGAYFVCTREQFEVEVERRKGEKDPYEDVNEGLPYIITDANGCKWERVSKSGSSATWKKRKPSISKDARRQLELYVQYRVDKYGDYCMKSDLSDYLSYHDII